jgi:DNA repair exonuclease SbcCD ATPase subunit
MFLKLKNFKCYDNFSITLKDQGLVLFSGASGSGKTTLLEAIVFVLTGHGKNILKQGKTSCSVEFKYDNIEVIRSKRPNRLVVKENSKVYEDKAGQEIINRHFGELFHMTSYSSQNSLNSFLTLSPVEKLSFLEQFTFKDIQLGDVKLKIKNLIHEKHNALISTTSKLETTLEMFKQYDQEIEPVEPINDIDQVELVTREELKNCEKLLHETVLAITRTTSELNDLKLLKIKCLDKQDRISELEAKRFDFNFSDYIGKRELKKLELQLEYQLNKQKLSDAETQYEKMKEEEYNNLLSQITSIEATLYTDYSKEECIEMISTLSELKADVIRVDTLKEELAELKSEDTLLSMINDLSLKKQVNHTKIANQVYICPSCDTHLQLENGDLVVTMLEKTHKDPDLYIKQKEYDRKYNTFQSELEQVKKVNIALKKAIKKLDVYDEILTLSEIQTSLDNLHEYQISQASDETRLKSLKKQLVHGSFSLQSFSDHISSLKEQLNEEYSSSISITELKEKITQQTELKYQFEMYEKTKLNNEREIEVLKSQLQTLKDKHAVRYSYSDFNFEDKIDEIEKNIVTIKEKEETLTRKKGVCISTLEHVSLYRQYKIYSDLKSNISNLKERENLLKEEYSAAMILKEKLLESESISLANTIHTMNVTTQLYLDMFFTENPISVSISAFKESKEKSKPQINIDVSYKDLLCDISMLSGGEFSRVNLAFTLALAEMFNTPLVMLDECTASLDQDTAGIVFESIKEKTGFRLVLIIAHQVISGLFDQLVQF